MQKHELEKKRPSLQILAQNNNRLKNKENKHAKMCIWAVYFISGKYVLIGTKGTVVKSFFVISNLLRGMF